MKKLSTVIVISIALLIGTSAFATGDEKKAEKKELKAQTVCPVMGEKINKKLFVDVKGKRIYVCCAGCIGMIKKNPDKYIEKLKKAGVTLEDVKVEKGKDAKAKHSGHQH